MYTLAFNKYLFMAKIIYSIAHKTIWLFAILFLTMNCSKAKNIEELPPYQLEHYTPEDGLPGKSIYILKQGSKGFLWGGTPYGVFQFDGHQFETYTLKDGLVNNAVWYLKATQDSRIWFFSHNPTAAYYDQDKTIKEYRLDSKISNSRIHDAARDDSGNLYIASTDGLYFDNGDTVLQFNASNTKFQSNGIKRLNWYHHSLYCVNNNKIFRVIRNDRNFSIRELKKSIENKVEHFSIFDGNLYAYAGHEVFKVQQDTLQLVTRLPDDEVNMRAFVQTGDFYMFTTQGYGIGVLDSAFNYIGKLSVLENLCPSHMIADRAGNVWVASIEKGLYKIHFTDPSISTYKPNFSFTNISKSLYSNGVYSSTTDGSIWKITKDTTELLFNFPSLMEIRIQDIFSVNDSTLWVCTDKGLHSIKLKNKTKQILLDNGNVYSFQKDVVGHKKGVKLVKTMEKFTSNEWLVAGFRKLFSLKKISKNQYNLKKEFGKRRINCLEMFSAKELMWIGTDKGLYYYQNDTVLKYKLDTLLMDTKVNDIHVQNGVTWIATDGYGVYCLINGNIHQVEEIISGIAYTVEIGPNHEIWVGTNMGVQRIRVHNFQPFQYSSMFYTSDDGLKSNETLDIKYKDSTIWLATKAGISSIDVTKGWGNKTDEVNTYIKEILVNGQKWVGDHLNLKHYQNNIEIDYSAIYTGGQSNIQFRYSVQQMDEDQVQWQNVEARKISLSSLQPGKYKFQVQARLKPESWSSDISSVSFTIHPPFYKTDWFYASSGSVFFLLLGLLYYIRDRQIRKQERQKTHFNQRIAQYELKAIQAQMNPHFVSNVLNAIQSLVLKKELKAANKFLTKFAKMMRLVLESSRNEFVMLEDERELLNTYMELEELRFKDRLSYSINVDEKLIDNDVMIPSFLLQPFVENAIKHGRISEEQEALQVSINFFEQNGQVVCQVIDNGPGFDPAMRNNEEGNDVENKKYPSRGIGLVKEKIEFLNRSGNYDISLSIQNMSQDAGDDSGTFVEISIGLD